MSRRGSQSFTLSFAELNSYYQFSAELSDSSACLCEKNEIVFNQPAVGRGEDKNYYKSWMAGNEE
jgi:hypothetical protein